MLAADTRAEVWTDATTLLNSHLNQLANTLLVEYLEWVNLQNLLLKICWEE